MPTRERSLHIKRLHTCPNCGWFRDIHVDQMWKEEMIDHPAHGRINNLGAAYMDVRTHDCRTYRETVELWREITGKKSPSVDTQNSMPQFDGPTNVATRKWNRIDAGTSAQSKKRNTSTTQN